MRRGSPVKKLNQPVGMNYVNRGVTERFMAGEYDSAPMGNDIVNFFENVISKASAQSTPTPTTSSATAPIVKKKTSTTTYIMLGLGGIALLGLGVFYMKNRSKKK